MWPTSGSDAIDLIQLIAALIDSPLAEATLTVPSSSTLILAPVFSTISRMTLPPAPITSRILSTGILSVSMRGAYSPSSARAAVFGLGQSDLHDFLGNAGDLDVHLQRGHAAFGASDLEIHVAEMVFVA